MSFPAYPSYQDSGKRWLGKLPESWRVVPFWTLFRRVKRIGFPEHELLSVYRDYGVIRKRDRDDNFNKPSEDLNAYQLVEAGDLAINKMKAWQGSLGVSPHTGIVSPAYFVYRARHVQLPAYLHYLLRSNPYAVGLMTISKGIRINQWDVDPEHLAQLPVSLPSLPEQAAIAAFLDRETAKIDALVQEQRRLIELLKEKRQAVISHAVTKGLDPTAPMKGSGVEWLGEVPTHWEIRPIGSLLRESPCYGVLVPDFDPNGVPMLRITDMRDGLAVRDELVTISPMLSAEYQRTVVAAGDLLLSVVGTIGESLIVNDNLVGVNLSRAVARLQPNEVTSATYLQWIIRAPLFAHFVDLTCVGTAQRVLNMGALSSMRVAVPPKDEQSAISGYLLTEIGKLEDLMREAQSAAALLAERRAALITAAVTGNIDIRAAAEVIPFPVDRARARGLVGTEIIERLARQPNFGRVKLQKIAFLAEAHVGVSELAGCYTREAAGPLDRTMIDEMESGARHIAGVTVDQAGGIGTAVSYQLHQQRGTSRQELIEWLGEARTARLDKLIADLDVLTTKGSEAVATLYGVWNDALMAGSSPTEGDIIAGFLNDWHPEKRQKFSADELSGWLEWMRRHGIVPTGAGPRTTSDSLFP